MSRSACKPDQLDELVGRKPSLIENALKRAAFEIFAMEGNRHDIWTAGMAMIDLSRYCDRERIPPGSTLE